VTERTLKNAPLVEGFIREHPEIVSFIEAAKPYLNKYFGQPLDLVLEVIHYPEPGANDELVAWIQSSYEIEEGLDRLEQFEDEWYLDNMGEVGRYFNINIETP
jgi:hypothetical protein